MSRLTFGLKVDNEVDKKGDSDNDNTMMVDSFTTAFSFSCR